MKMTRGEFRGLVALATVLAAVMAWVVWSHREAERAVSGADAAVTDSPLVVRAMEDAGSECVVNEDSLTHRRAKRMKVRETNGRTVQDAASPLDDVNS